ncbi:pyridoxamine 5'-phosphate oxidase family protein [Cellulomonas endophytica]|uniref:pyridoxamine 5'-phosphate oxidase family protein n=1 Tax=Cellulomonas endophytica TaxID=2494735 RepID=UPI0010127195|nr:pyridoxamine 5'-phosphate oxidase family protein [Cellulomonas endophytica]
MAGPGYPQALPLTGPRLDELLSTAEIARHATHDLDGSVHVAPLWFLYEKPDLLLGSQAESRKVRNLVRDPDATVLVDVTTPDLMGAMLRGTVEVERDDVVERRVRIFRRYVDEATARGMAEGLGARYDSVVLRFRPRSVVSFDYRKGSPA